MASKGPMITLKPKRPTPVKPSPKGGTNPKLPRLPGGKKPLPKLPKPKKDGIKKQAGGTIRDLLYRAKPGEVKKQRVEQIRKSRYDQMLEQGKISVMKKPDLRKGLEKIRKDIKYMNMMKPAGPVRKKKPVVPRKPGMGR